MKQYILPSLFTLSLLCCFSCRDDDSPQNVVFNGDMVKAGPEYVDPRDNSTYKTIQVGNQLWMAENLRYALPGYALDGAYTWGEPAIDKSKIQPDDASMIAIVRKVIDDPQYGGWVISREPAPPIKFGAIVLGWIKQIERGRMTIKDVVDNVAEVNKEMHLAIQKEMLNVIELPEVRARVGKASHDKAEKANGGYVRKYGYLYTFSGAKLAVPKGWRLPTDEDWQQLERSFGLSEQEVQRFEAWRGQGLAPLMSQGGATNFNAVYSGGKAYTAENTQYYTNKNRAWYFWTSSLTVQNDSIEIATIRLSNKYTDKVWRGTSRITNLRGYPIAYSVRCVRDLK